MSRTNQQRFNEAITYLEQFVSAPLAQTVRVALQAQADNVVGQMLQPEQKAGAAISLRGAEYWLYRNEQQHTAVRALLLCQHAFLKPPYAEADFAETNGVATKALYFRKTEEEVKQAIRCYEPVPNPTHADLERAARNVLAAEGKFDFETRRRSDESIGNGSIVCFNAVKTWLFNAGFVSLRWLAQNSMRLNANTANQILGNGTIIPMNAVAGVPAGHIFNFHAINQPSVCHWGVSLGGGLAAGSNTTAEWNARHGQFKVTHRVNFLVGDSKCGQFSLLESAQVCQMKYQIGDTPQNIVVRRIDPFDMPGRM